MTDEYADIMMSLLMMMMTMYIYNIHASLNLLVNEKFSALIIIIVIFVIMHLAEYGTLSHASSSLLMPRNVMVSIIIINIMTTNEWISCRIIGCLWLCRKMRKIDLDPFFKGFIKINIYVQFERWPFGLQIWYTHTNNNDNNNTVIVHWAYRFSNYCTDSMIAQLSRHLHVCNIIIIIIIIYVNIILIWNIIIRWV